jgi:hypothetical protein
MPSIRHQRLRGLAEVDGLRDHQEVDSSVLRLFASPVLADSLCCKFPGVGCSFKAALNHEGWALASFLTVKLRDDSRQLTARSASSPPHCLTEIPTPV